MVNFVRSVNSFVRDKRCHFFAASSHARQGETQRRLSLTTGWWLNCAADAVPSAFAFAIRTARDVLTRHMLWLALRASVNAVQKRFSRFCQTRHGLARRPCRASGEVTHLSTVFDARKMLHPVLKDFVSNQTIKGAFSSFIGVYRADLSNELSIYPTRPARVPDERGFPECEAYAGRPAPARTPAARYRFALARRPASAPRLSPAGRADYG